jgi:putative membrane protein
MGMTAQITTLLASGGDGWDHAWWPLWLLFWAAVIGAVVWFVTRRRRGDGLRTARTILAERYARGELTSEEYRSRLEQLQ